MKRKNIQIAILLCLLISCQKKQVPFDASGTFEAIETIISAEAAGKILSLNLTEGKNIAQGQEIGYIDSAQLHLTKLQLIQNRKAILSGRPDINTQVESLKKELANAIEDRKRMENLVKGEIASQKQLDDANTRIEVLTSKIEAQKSSLQTNSTSLTEQGNTLEVQLALINDQLRKCRIINPITGTVLTKYAEENEMASVGKPLYKIADLSTIILRAYISGNQLPKIKLDQKVKVKTDDGKAGFIETEGSITWISDKAEFTPKTIQTKDERANMVYAIKIKLANTGIYKIGMYGEINF